MLLERAYEAAGVVDSGRYLTTVNELCDHIPALRPELLRHVVDRLRASLDLAGCTKLLVEEEKAAVIGAVLSQRTGIPLAIARAYPYAPPGYRVAFVSEYSRGDLYINGVEPGDRVCVVDDTLSTGGTMISVLSAVRNIGAHVQGVAVAVEKAGNGGRERVRAATGIEIKALIRIAVRPDGVDVLPTGGSGEAAVPADFDFLSWLRPASLPGQLVVVEGTDGAGKTTLVGKLTHRLCAEGRTVLATFQPTKAVRATEVFRGLAETGCANEDAYRALYLVTLGDRLFHVRNTILPALADGAVVLCDRYFYTTVANVMARGQRFEGWFREAASFLTRPDLALLVHCPVEVALERIRARPEEEGRPVDLRHMIGVYEAFRRLESEGYLSGLDTTTAAEDETAQMAYDLIVEAFDHDPHTAVAGA